MSLAAPTVESVGREADRRAGETEALRRLPDDLAAGLVDTGIFRLWVPAEYGGAGAHLLTLLEAIEELAYHDGSTGWCAMIGGVTSLCAGFLPPAWADEIYGDDRAVTGGFAMPAATARPVDGGLRVSGRWQWGSFTHHCTWIGGGCRLVDDDGAPTPREDGLGAPFVFFDPRQVTLLDTWRVAGLKGTGSTDYEVRGAFVPEGRWVQLVGTSPVADGPLYRFPMFGALATGVAAVTLGLARRAVDELVSLAGAKRPANSSRSLAERPVVQADVARAEVAWRSGRSLLWQTAQDAWERAAAGDDLTGEHRRLLRLAATNATWRSAEAVDLAYHAGGGSSIHEASPLQRVFRDVHVATQHAMVAERTYEPVGRMAMGLPTDVSQL